MFHRNRNDPPPDIAGDQKKKPFPAEKASTGNGMLNRKSEKTPPESIRQGSAVKISAGALCRIRHSTSDTPENLRKPEP